MSYTQEVVTRFVQVSSEFSVFSDPDQSLIVGSANPSSSLGRGKKRIRCMYLHKLSAWLAC